MRERSIRMVRAAIADSGERQGALSRVAKQLGIGTESPRSWVKQGRYALGDTPSAELEVLYHSQRHVTHVA
jgi:transposase-like protein